jgi:hypothetical protein
MALIILETEARLTLAELTLVEYVLLVFASWRFTRLFTDDTITAFIREQFYDRKKVGRKVTLVQPKTGPRRVLADLFACPWCMGVWTTSVLVFAYFLADWMQYVVLILALSAVAAFLQLISHRVATPHE